MSTAEQRPCSDQRRRKTWTNSKAVGGSAVITYSVRNLVKGILKARISERSTLSLGSSEHKPKEAIDD
jgi:hypothetical protein